MKAMSDARSELEELRAALAASEQRAAAAEADLARARAVVSTSEAMIAGLKLEIALLKRDKYGRSAERSARLLDQLELQLEELVADAAEDRVQTERKTTKVGAFERRKPVKKAFPEHLPRERVVVEAPSTCSCCGSDRIVKMGEDVTETLEVIPRQWKVIQTVREKFPGLRPFMPQSVHWTLCRLRRTGLHPVGPARRSPNPRRPSIRSRGDGPVPACSR
jgi:multidrug efflux pump subunit AcrA (membrane-fusion protein)